MEGWNRILLLLSLSAVYLLSTSVSVEAGPPFQLDYTRRSPWASEKFSKKFRPSAISPRNRLPTNIIPIHYDLFIRPVLDEPKPAEGDFATRFTNPGTVEILINVTSPTSVISVHRNVNLTVHDVTVTQVGTNASVPVTNFTIYEIERHFMNITLGSPLAANSQYKLWINFTSILSQTTTDGLYLAKYTNSANEQKLLATTQFESISAREAFPSFDEPSLKATFSIAIAHNANYNTLCNSGKAATNVTNPAHPLPTGYTWDIYNKTVVMSTYLIAIIVSDFTCEKAPEGIFKDRPVQICGPPDSIDGRKGGVFAANASAHILDLFEKTFEFRYDMDKMDSVAIPSGYFGAGAMENWGLNTYQERYLLYFDGEGTVANQNSVYSILSHELGHQWFGNTLTCAWWSNIWLNEGFATYVSYMYNEIAPHFDTRREMLVDTVQYALSYDVNRNSPIINSALTVDEVDRVFGTITYDKGGSLIRMMEGFLGNDTLLKGLRAYLDRFQYTGVQQDQLFSVLTEVAHNDSKIPSTVTIKDIMDTWTLQSGYPLIRVSKASADRVIISQEEYRPVGSSAPSNPSVGVDLDEDDLWAVPISISNETLSSTAPTFWLSKNTALTTYAIDTTKWFLINTDAMGYYRVLYDDELLALIHAQLAADLTKISALNRAQFLDDYVNFYKHGHVHLNRSLEFTKYLTRDSDHIVWTTFIDHYRSRASLLSSSDDYLNYMIPRVEAALEAIDFNGVGDEGSRVIFRSRLYDFANVLGSARFRAVAYNQVYLWETVGDSSAVRLDYQSTVYCGAVAQSERAFTFLLNKYKSETRPAFKTRLLNGLACASDDAVIRNFLTLTLDENEIRKEDAVSALVQSARNSPSRTPLIDFLRNTDNFNALKTITGSTTFLTTILETLSSESTELPELTLLHAVVDQYAAEIDSAEVQRLKAAIVQNIQENIVWLTGAGEGKAMLDWFKDN